MTKLIAFAGKGGTGKSTLAALTIKYLVEQGKSPVFAVDADPNYTLGDALGIEVETNIGLLREKFMDERTSIPAGMSKNALLEMQMQAAVQEGKDIDLLVMGRQEGPGCYCALNDVLRSFLDMATGSYPYVVVDNEAGMEHLSRRTTRRIDSLVVVAEHSVKAARAAGRINQLVNELKLDVDKRYLILNKVPGEPAPQVLAESEKSGLELLQAVPYNEELAQLDAQGRPIIELAKSNPTYGALAAVLPRVVA